jgi:hypothetical protein
MAGKLTTQNKMKFILSQVIFNSVLIGVQIQTGGVFTLLELGLDSVVSPLAAKAIGVAISSEQVREFEKKAYEEHHRLLQEIYAECQDRFQKFLDSAGEGLAELDRVLGEIGACIDGAMIDKRFVKALLLGKDTDSDASREPGKGSNA